MTSLPQFFFPKLNSKWPVIVDVAFSNFSGMVWKENIWFFFSENFGFEISNSFDVASKGP